MKNSIFFLFLGSYSQSTGVEIVRKHVAEFITARDGGIPTNSEDVILSGGASESIRNVLKLFINKAEGGKRKAGIMIPIPQYPLYSASIEEFNLGQANQPVFYNSLISMFSDWLLFG